MPSVNLVAMLNNYTESLRIGAHPQYRAIAYRFITAVKGDLTHDSIADYIDALLEEGYAIGTIAKMHIRVIRQVCATNGVAFPLKRGEWPEPKEGDVIPKSMHRDLIARYVETAKTSRKVRADDRALLALSTVYGMRRVELATMGPVTIDLKAGIVYVNTAKHGRERWHGIPPVIRPYLQIRWAPKTPYMVSESFWRLTDAAGLGNEPMVREMGWHSIRRALVRGLEDAHLQDTTINIFMRWARSKKDMRQAYASVVVVGEGGEMTDPGRLDKETDTAVFAVHPFLSLWEG